MRIIGIASRREAGRPQGHCAGVPERVRIHRPQSLVQHVAGAHHPSDLRIHRPRQQSEERLREPECNRSSGAWSWASSPRR